MRDSKGNKCPSALLTVREAAELLHVHTNTVRRWAAQGMLRELRVGPRHDRRFYRSDLERLLLWAGPGTRDQGPGTAREEGAEGQEGPETLAAGVRPGAGQGQAAGTVPGLSPRVLGEYPGREVEAGARAGFAGARTHARATAGEARLRAATVLQEFVVVLRNEPQALAEFGYALGEARISITGFLFQVHGDFCLFRFTAGDPGKAEGWLQSARYAYRTGEAVVACGVNGARGVGRLAQRLAARGVNIEAAYYLAPAGDGEQHILFVVDNVPAAVKALR